MNRPRTYWHLAELTRKPNEYDIGTSRLLYHPDRGFEVPTPVSAWYERFGRGSALVCRDWERFRDPRETTYASYTALQSQKETFVDGLFRSAEETGYDARLSAAWMAALDRTIGPLRYPVHGLQMVCAYVGQLAPSGRIVVTCLLQSADEVRRIERFAYRTRQLRESRPSFAVAARAAWEKDALWQPLRRALEQLLVTYPWGEAFAALNLCLKPAFDDLFTTRFAALARACGDDMFADMLFSLGEDARWHREWTAALARMTVEERPENLALIDTWTDEWNAITRAALAPFAPVFDAAQALATERSA